VNIFLGDLASIVFRNDLIAEAYEENVQTTVKRLVSLLEPLLIVVMGGVVGFIVIAMLLAIFSINEIPF
jgi:general secretion pathway protein F